MTQGYLGGSEENPFIIPGVCGVGEINRGVHAGFIYILLCEPNTLTWGKEDEWVVWGEEVRQFQRQGGALEGKKEVRDGEVRELFIHKVFWCTHTGWSNLVGLERLWGTRETFLDLDAGGIQWLHKYHMWTVLNCRRKTNPSYLPGLRDIWRQRCLWFF